MRDSPSSGFPPEGDMDLRGISNTLQLLSEKFRTMISQSQSQLRPQPSSSSSSSSSQTSQNCDYAGLKLVIEKLKGEVAKLTLQNEKLKETEEKFEEFKEKSACLESELALCWDEIGSLKSELQEERKNRQELESKLSQENERFEKELGELKDKNGMLEGRISELEMRPPLPPPPEPIVASSEVGREALELLTSLSEEIQNKFRDWSGGQVELREELGRLKEVVENLRRIQGEDDVPMEPPPSPTSSPVLDLDLSVPFHVKLEPDIGIEEESESTMMIVDSSSLAPISTPSADIEATPPAPAIPFGGMVTEGSNAEEEEEEETATVQSTSTSSPPRSAVDTLLNELFPDMPIPNADAPPPKIPKRLMSFLMEHGLHDSLELTCICDPDFKFKSESNLNEHIRRYTDKFKFRCPICQKLFFRRNELKHHLERYSALLQSDQAIRCIKCGVQFSSISEHKIHLKNCVGSSGEVSSSNPVDDGDQGNGNKEDEGPIEVIIHGKAPTPTIYCGDGDGTTPSTFVCFCGSQFQSEDGIQNHITHFTVECKLTCNLCKSRFREKEDLQGHMQRVHKLSPLKLLFSKATSSQRQNRTVEEEEPTSSTNSPDNSPAQGPSNKRKGSVEEPQSGSKRPRLNYPVRRASQNPGKPSSPSSSD